MVQQANKWKVFICHSSKDKDAIVRPLAKLLHQFGSEIWYDEFSISPSDYIDDKIHIGLEESKGGIIIVSEAFIKIRKDRREWIKEELYVLLHKRKVEKGFLITVFYDISRDQLPKEYELLSNINGFDFNIGDNLADLAKSIYEDIKKEQVKAEKILFEHQEKHKQEEKRKIKNKSAFLVLLVIIAALLLFIVINKNVKVDNDLNPKNQIAGTTNQTENKKQTNIIETGSINKTKSNNNQGLNNQNQITDLNNNKISQENNISNPQRKLGDNNNFYVNSSLANTLGKIDIFVIIVDEIKNIETSISIDIADIYKNAGRKVSTGLFKSNFIKKQEFQELFEGDAEIIEKLDLNKYSDYLVLGKLSFSFKEGELVKNTVVCHATLTVSIIATSTKSISDNFSIQINTNGHSENQAKTEALDRIKDLYIEEHSTI